MDSWLLKDKQPGLSQRRLVHANCVARPSVLNGFSGVLILGKSGSGKSDLSLRVMLRSFDPPFVLVADDYVEIERGSCFSIEKSNQNFTAERFSSIPQKSNDLTAYCPEAIQGKMEIRGLGVVDVPHQPWAKIVGVVQLVDDRSVIDRMPASDFTHEFYGAKLPSLFLDAFEAAAVEKLVMFMHSLEVK